MGDELAFCTPTYWNIHAREWNAAYSLVYIGEENMFLHISMVRATPRYSTSIERFTILHKNTRKTWKKNAFFSHSGAACFYHLRGHCVDVNWFPRDLIVRSCGVGVIGKMFFSDWDNSCKGPLKSEQRAGKSIYGTTSCRVDVTWRWNRADESKYWVDGDKLLPKYHKGKQVGRTTSRLGRWDHARGTWMQHNLE